MDVAAGAASNLSIKIAPECSFAEVEEAIGKAQASDPESFATPVNEKALDGLKFSACLPEWLARQTLSQRMTDVEAIQAVLAERARFVTVT